ncbi:PTS hybrid protein [Sanguibacter gelidistatuariae]|uniref:Phosphocarrier protein HPr n=1 Tax=Sanguibacter gelidistatuariae TaxID=1814289 RepID=A0A1G6NGM8_9MICO|nr:dihydroxyacetone kinase phosphoryl donor subunit DhaM [Sanguibacter gelidistatuariae]SDC66982.1 PTS hybrid protein [Sanguibacter gelidistatuariae]
MRARVALVLVSHSERLAQGTVELAQQMAPQVLLLAAGGMTDGGLGTSYDRVFDAVSQGLAAADGVVVLADLGSAILTVESVLEVLSDDAERVVLADAPFVEGSVAAAVTAHGGGTVAEVLESAEHAGSTFAVRNGGLGDGSAPAGETARDVVVSDPDACERTVVVRNPLGLHARPAAVLARLIAGFDAKVTVNGVNGASVLELMKLGATGGQGLVLSATGPQAREAVAAVADAIEGGFGEV